MRVEKGCKLISEYQKTNPMKKIILALALAAGLTSFAGSAKAGLTFDFTLIDDLNPSKSVNLNLILNDAGTSATSASITGTTGGIHFDANRNFASDAYNNAFSVDNGKITSALFNGFTYNYTSQGSVFNVHSLNFQSYSSEDWYGVTPPNFSYNDSVYDYRVNGGSYTQDDSIYATVGIPGQSTAAVPEPSQVAASMLLVAGIAGFVIVKRRKEASALEALAA
jgi:hypothetical protein